MAINDRIVAAHASLARPNEDHQGRTSGNEPTDDLIILIFGLIGRRLDKELFAMVYLYGHKADWPPKLVATFDSEPQLLAYVRWATLSENGGVTKFEQGSPLASFQGWSHGQEPPADEDVTAVLHNPSPSML